MKVYDPMGELHAAITAMKIGTKQGQQAQELALIIINAHKGYMPNSLDPFRMLCENHLHVYEEEEPWPCDEVRKLATVLGVDLE